MPMPRRIRNILRKGYARKKHGKGRFARFMPHAKNALGVALQALSAAKMVASLVNAEAKRVDTTVLASAAYTATWQIIPLSLMAQGSTDATRNGNSIKARAISIKGFTRAGLLSVASQEFRFVLFIDKVSDGVVPSASDLFDNNNNVLDRYNVDNAGSRFLILKDLRLPIGYTGTKPADTPAGLPSAGTISRCWSIYKRLGHHVKFNGTDATQASASTGHIYCALIASDATNPIATITARFDYYDN